MEAIIKGMIKVGSTFKQNILAEYRSNEALKQEVSRLTKPVSGFGNSLGRIFNRNELNKPHTFHLKDYKPSLLNRNIAWFREYLKMPTFYGGYPLKPIPDKELFPFDKILRAFPLKCLVSNRFYDCNKIYADYKVLNRIENTAVKELMLDIFNFKEPKNCSAEAFESIKKMRAEMLDVPLKGTEIVLTDLRRNTIDKIFMKNGKKTVKCNFELTSISKGLVGNKEKYIEHNYGCILEFIKDGGEWVASGFTYSRF